MFGKNKIAALVAEFLGTGLLTLLILTVQRSTIGVPFFIAMGAGLAVILLTFAFAGATGAYFNPALTLAAWTARKVETVTGIVYIIVQLLGAWAALGLYTYFTNAHVQSIGSHYSGRVLVAEAFGTGLFSFAFAATIYRGANRQANAVFAGLGYMLGILAASSAAIGLLNPAVALGVRAWIPFGSGVSGWGTYLLGPIIGAIVGVNLYNMIYAEGGLKATAKAAVTPAKSKTSSKSKK